MALPSFGTNTSFDTLKSSTQTIADFGEDRAWDAISELLAVYNRQASEVTGFIVDTTTDRMRRYGAGATMEMQRTDEVGIANAQKVRQNAICGFPLEKYEIALQWTRIYFQTRLAGEFAAQIEAVTTASMRRFLKNIKIAVMFGVDYNFNDYLVDHLDNQFSLPVRALVNADGQPIPPGPNGETFNATTHTHYLASASLTNAWAIGLVDTVLEHTAEGAAMIWISRADASSWSALADFKPMTYVTTIKSETQEYGVGDLNPTSLNNRQIGWFHGCAIWVKPYWPTNYAFVFMTETGLKPLCKRVRGVQPDSGGAPVQGAGDLQLIYQNESHPLRSTGWEQTYGVGVWNRTSAAVGFYNGSQYQQPALSTL